MAVIHKKSCKKTLKKTDVLEIKTTNFDANLRAEISEIESNIDSSRNY